MWTGIYVAVSYIPSRSIFSILGLISMSSTWGSTVSHRIMFLWGMLYPLTIYAFLCIFLCEKTRMEEKTWAYLKRSMAVTSINFNCWRQDFRVKILFFLFTALIVF